MPVKFSILIPTRNRRDLLITSALPTILGQTDGDFEAIICDNASSDGTGEAVAAIADPRIRYVRSDQWIAKEEIFMRGVQYARGEYFLWFFDDDAMLSSSLAKIRTLTELEPADLITFPASLLYVFPDYPDPERADKLSSHGYGHRALVYESRPHLDLLYRNLSLQKPTPMVTNTVFRTAYFNRILERFPNILLHGHMGDYNIACFTLAHTDRFIYLDEPLVLFGHWASNTSAQLHDLATTMPEYRDWIAWVTATLLKDMPWPRYLWPNAVAASLMDCSRILSLELDIDLETYFQTLTRDIVRLRPIADVADLARDLEATIAGLGAAGRIDPVRASNPELTPPVGAECPPDGEIAAYAAVHPRPDGGRIDPRRAFRVAGSNENGGRFFSDPATAAMFYEDLMAG